MLLGYNTNGFASHALDDALRVIADVGYRSVGITVDHHALNPFRGDWVSEADRIGRLAGDLGLVVVVETGARFLLDPRRKHRPTLLEHAEADRRQRIDFLHRCIQMGARMGAGVVSLWSGAAPEGSDTPRPSLEHRLVAGLREVCDLAQASSLVVGFEPEPGMFVESMSQYERIAAAVDHSAFRLTLDVGHAHLTEADGAPATVRRFRDAIVNVHLEGMQKGVHDHLPPWEGDLDVREVLRALDEIGYGGPATFELSRHSHAAVDTARRAFDFATSG